MNYVGRTRKGENQIVLGNDVFLPKPSTEILSAQQTYSNGELFIVCVERKVCSISINV